MKPDISFYNAVSEMTIPEVERAAVGYWQSWTKRGSGNEQEIKIKLDFCLMHRRNLLNNHFQLTNQEFERFRVVATLFAEKTEMVFRNTRRIYKQLHEEMKSGAGGDFSDFYVEASIQACYNDTDSIVSIEDDSGSDYAQFAEILDTVSGDYVAMMAKRLDYNPDATPDDKFFRGYFCCEYDEYLQLNTTWHLRIGMEFPKLLEIPVCYALHQLSDHVHYSLPDIIRINDVWSEVRVGYQNICCQ